METNVTNGNRKSDMFICSSGEETLQLLGFQLGNVGNCGKNQRSEQIEGPQGPRAQPAHFKFSWPTIPAKSK